MIENLAPSLPRRLQPTPAWQRIIWIGAGGSLFLVIVFLLALVAWTVERVTGIIVSRPTADLAFITTGVGMVTLTLLRFLAILIGGAIAFAGLAVSFFTHDSVNFMGVGAEQNSLAIPKMTLATYSPGIVGLIVGAAVMVSALYATSEHQYSGPSTVEVVQSAGSAEVKQLKTMRSPEEVLEASR